MPRQTKQNNGSAAAWQVPTRLQQAGRKGNDGKANVDISIRGRESNYTTYSARPA